MVLLLLKMTFVIVVENVISTGGVIAPHLILRNPSVQRESLG